MSREGQQLGRRSGRRRSPLPILAAALALVCGPLAGPGEPQDAAQQSLRNRGQALYEEKQHVAAAAAFQRVVQQSGATARDWINLALALYETAVAPAADDAVRAALDAAGRLDPQHAGVPYLRGLLHAKRGEIAEAQAALSLAAELDPADPAIRYNLGASYETLRDLESAQRHYAAVMAMGFDIGLQHFVSATYRSAFLLMRGGDRQAAAPLLERHQMYQRQLSQAQRAPAALEAGHYKRVEVPRINFARPSTDSAERLMFTRREVRLPAALEGRLLAADLGAGRVELLQVGSTEGASGGGRAVVLDAAAGPVALGDADRDGSLDVYVATASAGQLFRNLVSTTPAARFELVETAGLPVTPDATKVTWVDADHDGDLDVLIAVAGSGPGLRLVLNHGGDEFADATVDAGLGAQPPAIGVTWADFDDDNDIDLYVVGDRAPTALYTNLRGGRFEEIAGAVGASGDAATVDAIAEDFDNDGAVDLVLGGAYGLRGLRNDGDGTFDDRPIDMPAAVRRIVAGDLDNDGWLDLVVETGDEVHTLLNIGEWRFVAGPVLDSNGGELVDAFDGNGDGSVDILVSAGSTAVWYEQPAPLGAWLSVRLQGIKNNIRGVGASVEVKSGGLYQRRRMRRDAVHVGLGDLDEAEVVRITWPNGILQNETAVAVRTTLGPVTEVERLEGSCPLLYTWDGNTWRFINEVLGVAPLGMPLATGVIHPADFDEYVPVPGEALQPRDGVLELRLSEELREAGYLDAVRLLAVDHPETTLVIPDEKFVAPPHPELRLFVVDEPRPVTAVDQDGRDWSAAVASIDGVWPAPFEPALYEGLATSHALDLSLPDAGAGGLVRLYLTGWVYWATASVNLVVDEDPRVAFAPVALEVPDGRGGWRTAIEDIGLPNGKNSTISVDVTGIIDPQDPRIRVTTTMRLYWDAVFYTVGGPHPRGLLPTGNWKGEWEVPHGGTLMMRDAASGAIPELSVHVLEPAGAEIRWRGFSALRRTADGYETFDYENVSSSSNWDPHRGSYTRYGAVGELVGEADDRYVIIAAGDEVVLRFADTLPPVQDGWRRDWLVYLNGWVKDGDPNTLHGDRVEPLPFHAMSGYPYGLGEQFPDSPLHRAWQAEYNTRPARRVNRPLDRD